MSRHILTILLLLTIAAAAPGQPRPSMLLSEGDVRLMRASLGTAPLFDAAVADAKRRVDAAIAAPMDVPVPADAGGYTHERHKQNYTEMQLAGVLFQLTRERRYADFVRTMLLKYAALYPSLGRHPSAAGEAHGRLFWQSLNETVWLVNVAQAYDCVYDAVPAADRTVIERDLLRPMVKFFTVEQSSVLNRIHNHGSWMAASVGMAGFALRDTAMVSAALYGTGDAPGGYLRLLDGLFSPDGYYTEGAYYIRYAIMPFFVFAKAVDNNRPGLRIFAYRDSVLKRAFNAMLQLTYTTGQFLPFNDALKEKSYRSPEVITALNIAYATFGAEPSLLTVAKEQGSVTLTGGGCLAAKGLAATSPLPPFPYRSLELRDGPQGERGGIGILRHGGNDDQLLLLMKYTGHGLSHGHYDKLSLMMYDQQREQLQDYGAARFINVEPKYGGRYLPETKSFAMQTIAHNTVTVDERSHFGGDIALSERFSGTRHFFDAGTGTTAAMSARCNDAVPGVRMQRTVVTIADPSLPKPLAVDLFRVVSDREHTYDLPFYYIGQFLAMNQRLTQYTERQEALGTAPGYRHLWKEAEGRAQGMVQFTWLSGNRYYSVSSAADTGTTVCHVRIGANDPNINLRREPAVILRTRGTSALFASVIEPHGLWDGTIEISRDAASGIAGVTVLASTDEGSVVRLDRKNGKGWTVMVANGAADAGRQRSVTAGGTTYRWTGNYAVTVN